MLAFSTSSQRRIELSGFFTSCATPAVTRPKRSQPLGNLQLIADALERFHVAQGDERAHARAVFANHLCTQADPVGARAGFEVSSAPSTGSISSSLMCKTFRMA